MNENEEGLVLLRRACVLALVLLAITVCIVVGELRRFNAHDSLSAGILGIGGIVLVGIAVVVQLVLCQRKLNRLRDHQTSRASVMRAFPANDFVA